MHKKKIYIYLFEKKKLIIIIIKLIFMFSVGLEKQEEATS